ncbi:MAG: hypothetical protein HZB98_11010 [Bacteroidia bacterium]|nr:hypothetical protein [Bacteroidia bacterium]
MNLKISYKYLLITTYLILSVSIVAFSQGTDLSLGKKPGIFFSASVIPGKSLINFEGIHGISGLESTREGSISGSFRIGYILPSRLGFSAGTGYSSYKTVLTLDSYQNNYSTKDSENESYEMRVSGSGINEEQEISFLNFPLYIYYSFPLGKLLELYIEPGIIIGMPLDKAYTSTGTLTTKGFYAAYNVLLENMPAYGFANNRNTSTAGEMEIKSMVLNAAASAGIEYIVKEKIKIGAGIFYSRSFSNISEYSSPGSFKLISDQGQLNSMMGSADKVTLSSFGVNISLRYFITK